MISINLSHVNIRSPYEMKCLKEGGWWEVKDFNTSQLAFDYCAEHYPGEPVSVDIQP